MREQAAGEVVQIVSSVKRALRSRGMTYAQLAQKVGLSEASIKRILSRGTLSLARLQQICQALDFTIGEVTRLASQHTQEAPELLTLEQESALAADERLLACFYLLVNGHTGREVGAELDADERQVRRWMTRLVSLRLIEIRSGLRARTRTASAIAWRKDGPVRRLYEKRVREEFMRSSFGAPAEALHFCSAELSEASYRVLLRKLERLAAEFRDLAALDRSLVGREKRSVAMLLAARPWIFSMFEGFQNRARGPT